jgi:hypothetical protein
LVVNLGSNTVFRRPDISGISLKTSRNIKVYQAKKPAYTIEHGESKSRGPDILVSFHDESHYNSVRNPEALPSKDYLRRFLAEKEEDMKEPNVTSSMDNVAGADPPGLHVQRAESVTPDSSIIQRRMEKLSLVKPQPKRSDPCPCGSGKVFGKCHHADYRRANRLDSVRAKNCQDEDDKGRRDPKQDTDSSTPKSGPFREIKI